ncbi:hypothetical protein LIER_22971 [Lithospermum erythrorhizon]|uniref:Uncharacterized protein n=1 Tax=Lithospermum erythrorhizon TaxID=34254 RepID=A0AAV3QX11_LITER
MDVGVHRIWTLHDKSKGYPIPTDADLDTVAKVESLIPQGNNKLPWYTFYDEAILVTAGLVHDKEFDPVNTSDPPSWEEIAIYATFASKPNEIDFGEMLSERHSIFTRVAITSKIKPNESLIPVLGSTPPLPTSTIPAHVVSSVLKRLASEISGPNTNPPTSLGVIAQTQTLPNG